MDEDQDSPESLLYQNLATQNVLSEVLVRLARLEAGDGPAALAAERDRCLARIERHFGKAGEAHGSEELHRLMHLLLHHTEAIWEGAILHAAEQP